MAEDLRILESANKAELYQSIIPQIQALVKGETEQVANLANVAAALKEQFNWLWIGFYLVKNGELVLGPFQGPVACTRIQLGKGVCGTAWAQEEILIVADVDDFPGHIACSSLSKSEIVVPLVKNGQIYGVLDVDSEHLAHFDEVDAKYLEQVAGMLNG